MKLLNQAVHTAMHEIRDYIMNSKDNIKKGDFRALCSNAGDLITILGGDSPDADYIEKETKYFISSLKMLRKQGGKTMLNKGIIQEEFDMSLKYASRVMENLYGVLHYQ